MIVAGLPTQEIMRQVPHATDHLIRKVRISIGQRQRRGRPVWKSPETQQMIIRMREMKQSGETYEAIGIKFGMTRQKAHQFLMIHAPIPDGSKCAKCGKESKKLHRHHTNYITDEYELICVSCHTSLHLVSHKITKQPHRAGMVPTRHRLKLCQEILAKSQGVAG